MSTDEVLAEMQKSGHPWANPKFTKGPWKVEVMQDVTPINRDDDGNARLRLAVMDSRKRPVASLFFRTKPYGKDPHPKRGNFIDKEIEAEANANLLADAPDLLKACQSMLESWQEMFGSDACDCRPEPENTGHVCDVCNTKIAIAKALGQ